MIKPLICVTPNLNPTSIFHLKTNLNPKPSPASNSKLSFSLKLVLALLMGSLISLYTPQALAEENPNTITNINANTNTNTNANDNANANANTSISLTPVSNVLSLSAGETYDYSFSISNHGVSAISFEVFAAPYSYVHNPNTDTYQLGFSQENNFTQITRWITFRDQAGAYTQKATFTANPGETTEVFYRITTPTSIPSGGQYAVIFAHALNESSNSTGIQTEASPGLIIYGRATGETISSSEISHLNISQRFQPNNASATKTQINASARVKNTGNVDFAAISKLEIKSLFGQTYYTTPVEKSKTFVIPESELKISDVWENTPFLGIFQTTWSVTVNDKTETISNLVIILPLSVIIIALILLTILIIWLIFFIKRRRSRRARFNF